MPSIIIIGAPEQVRELVRGRGENVLAFSSLIELDRWRDGQVADETFGPDLIAALDEIGCPLAALPRRLRCQLEALASRTEVPPMSVLAREWPSRRSFYRIWSECIADTPSALLRRLRARHAQRLMEMGRSKKEAAYRAGFSSVDQMRRNLPK
jgi:AraC-like DNA-binding protein